MGRWLAGTANDGEAWNIVGLVGVARRRRPRPAAGDHGGTRQGRRYPALAVALALTVGLAAAPADAQSCDVCGDANGDGVTDIVDAMFIAQLTVGLRTFVPCPLEGDVNMSVGLDIVDALFIAQHTVNLRGDLTCLPPFGLTIETPQSLQLFGSSPVTVQGTLTGQATSLTCNTYPASVASGVFTASVAVGEGTTVIACVAHDTFGRTATASVTVELDTTPPRVVIDAPSDGATVNAAEVVVTGMVNDVVVGTVNGPQAQVACNGLTAQVANRTFAVAGIPVDVGLNTITCTATDRVGNVGNASIDVTFDNTVRARIDAVSGDFQSATIGGMLGTPLVVALTDDQGQPVPNKPVIFEVTQNDGTLVNGTMNGRSVVVHTDGAGQAQAAYTLGTRAGLGNNQVRATAIGLAGEAVFCASALPAAAASIVIDSGNNQRGVIGNPLPRPFVTIVVDPGSNRLGDVPVTFAVVDGGGSFAGQPAITVLTDSDGRAQAVLRLGPADGFENNVVQATFPGSATAPATFVASAQMPADPAATRVSGVVLDNTDTPVPGASLLIANTTLSTMSDAQGQFTISGAPVGRIVLLVDGSTVQLPGTWPNLEFEMVTVAGQNNTVGRGPIYMLPLELPGQPPDQNKLCVDASTGGTITLADVPGLRLTILPGSATFPNGSKTGCIMLTPVHPDKAPMVPNFGQQPRIMVTIQPAGTRFEPPAPMTLPNADGLAPGQKTDMFSYDHELFQFVSIGTGTVSDDGLLIRSDPGVGVIKAGWHCGGNPQSNGTCEHECDDGNDCTMDVSMNGMCVTPRPPMPDGTQCKKGPSKSRIFGLVNVVIDDSCYGKCMSGTCEHTGPRVSNNEILGAITDAVQKLVSGCVPSPLFDEMWEGLLDQGLRIMCLTQQPPITGCASAAPGFNVIRILNNDHPGCGFSLAKKLRHEMQHAYGGHLHTNGPTGHPICAGDAVYACDQKCYGCNSCGPISAAAAQADCH